jgi:hypothetical protein
MALGVKSRNLACVANITKIVSLTTMHAPESSPICGFREKPSASKKATDFGRSATGRLTNICLLTVLSYVSMGVWIFTGT